MRSGKAVWYRTRDGEEGATNAENQVILASYNMMFIMGDLKVENIKTNAIN